MFLEIKGGATSRAVPVFLQDSSSSTGAGFTGLVFNSVGLTCKYKRQGANASVTVNLVTASLGTFTDSGFKEIDSVGMRGSYEFGIPNAAIAAGAQWVEIQFMGAGIVDTPILIQLTGWDDQDGVAGGMTALPSVAAGAVGGLPITDVNNTVLATLYSAQTWTGIYAANSTGQILKNINTWGPTGGVTLNAVQSSYAPSKAGDAMTLTSGERTAVAAAWGASVIGNGRTRDYFLQGGVNKIAFSSDGLTVTVYSTDDTTVLWTGPATRLANTIGGLQSVDPP